MDALLAHLGPFLLVLFRISGLFVFAPALSSPILPARVRVLLCLTTAVALYPALPAGCAAPVNLDWVTLGVAVATETLIGMVIGLIASLPMYAVQLGGLIMGQQMGMGLANIYNPALDIEGDVIGQMLIYLAIAIYIVLGGLEACFLATAHSFSSFPAGGLLTDQLGSFSSTTLALLTGIVSSGLELAMRISAPVLCIILMETVATAFIMKTMPQLNIMSLGFATKVLAAFVALLISLGSISYIIKTDTDKTLLDLLDFSHDMNPALHDPMEHSAGGLDG